MIRKDIFFFSLFLMILSTMILIQFEDLFISYNPTALNEQKIKPERKPLLNKNNHSTEKALMVSLAKLAEKNQNKKKIILLVFCKDRQKRDSDIVNSINLEFRNQYLIVQSNAVEFYQSYPGFPVNMVDDNRYSLVLFNNEGIIIDSTIIDPKEKMDSLEFIRITFQQYDESKKINRTDFNIEMAYRAYLSNRFFKSRKYLQIVKKRNNRIDEKQMIHELETLLMNEITENR